MLVYMLVFMLVYMLVSMVVSMLVYTVVSMVVHRNENSEPGYWTQRQSVEPRPRYAHQLVYDEVLNCRESVTNLK